MCQTEEPLHKSNLPTIEGELARIRWFGRVAEPNTIDL